MTRLIAYALEGRSVAEIRPAPLQRAWMDATGDRHAYLCVPLAIANQFGWEVLAPYAISAWWDGSEAREGVRVMCDVPPGKRRIAYCAFGYGILSFELPYIFRTEPGIDLFVTGPLNRFKDGIAPQTGVMETRLEFFWHSDELAVHARESPCVLRKGRTLLPYLSDTAWRVGARPA